jgi:predicted methyltransferase
MNILLTVGAAGLIAATCAMAEPTARPPMSADIAKALDDPRRPPEQKARDPLRKPAELMAFAGVKPGDAVADIYSGGGYYTRLLAAVVGSKGRVYAMIPAEMARNCAPDEFAGAHEVERDRRYGNVDVLTEPAAMLATPRPLDVIWSSQNYHDLHDRFMEGLNVAVTDKAFFRALKPGGVLVVIDHVAEAGSGLRDTDTLHRIDPMQIRKEVEAAGFVFVAESQALRNPQDDHRLKVFDPRVRGRTDQVVLKFIKPS